TGRSALPPANRCSRPAHGPALVGQYDEGARDRTEPRGTDPARYRTARGRRGRALGPYPTGRADRLPEPVRTCGDEEALNRPDGTAFGHIAIVPDAQTECDRCQDEPLIALKRSGALSPRGVGVRASRKRASGRAFTSRRLAGGS